jgi:hypothetical protein
VAQACRSHSDREFRLRQLAISAASKGLLGALSHAFSSFGGQRSIQLSYGCVGVHLADWRGVGNGPARAQNCCLGWSNARRAKVRRSNRVGCARRACVDRAGTVAARFSLMGCRHRPIGPPGVPAMQMKFSEKCPKPEVGPVQTMRWSRRRQHSDCLQV